MEEWRKIPLLDDYYEVSSLGRVRTVTHKIVNNEKIQTIKGRILSPKDNGHGYKAVHIKDKTMYIHRLVAEMSSLFM